MTAKTNMLVTLSAGVFLAGSACAELTYTETAEPTGGWVISINGKNYAVGLNGKVKINGDAIVTADGYNIDKDYRVTYDGREITATDNAIIFNDTPEEIRDINDTFVNLQSYAVYNYSNNDMRVGSVSGNFIGNRYTSSNSSYDNAFGGALRNHANAGIAIIENVNGVFVNNSVYSQTNTNVGGAISNGFHGAATFYNAASRIGSIDGIFVGNYVLSESGGALGGAIINASARKKKAYIDTIKGCFIGNYTRSNGRTAGGAIANYGGWATEQADSLLPPPLESSEPVQIGSINGEFAGNYSLSTSAEAMGGAIYNAIGIIGDLSGRFIGNYAKTESASHPALGGAVYSANDLTISADGTETLFRGNYTEDSRGKINNAVWMQGTDEARLNLNLDVRNGGKIVFDDEIDGGKAVSNQIEYDGYAYDINITGDVCPQCTTNSVIFNSRVNNVYDFKVDTTQVVLGKNASVNITHDYIAVNNPYLRLDVDAANGQSGRLNIGGDVIGTTKVIVNTLNYKDIRGEESIVFASAPNDGQGNENSFSVFRVVGSPYMWEVEYNETDKTWGLAMNSQNNDYTEDCAEQSPDVKPTPHPMPAPGGKAEVAPEVIGYQSVTAAAVAQNANLIYNVMNKVTDNRLYCPGCGFYDYYWNGEAFHNLWVNPVYTSLSIKSPTEIDADVWGIEAGGDLQHDLNNKLGLFVSYRKGSYDMNGGGERYYSTVGSEIDIDSYLAGLYYRYDRNNWYAFATLYGGIQQADIKTDDGIKSDTDGVEFGASLEAGYDYNLTDTVYLTPSLGVFYTQVNYDDATDSVGKKAEYNDLKQIELEAGVKLTKAFRLDEGYANVYVKPSVVQTLVDGDEVNITGLGKTNTLDDETLGRIELGGRYGFTDQLSAYGWANYTFGSDYDATTVGLGLNCAW